MKSKKRLLKEATELTSGKGWCAIFRIFGLSAIEIALDFREMYRIKNCPTLKVED